MNTDQAVRRACLWLPAVEESLSHGMPHFRIGSKSFASYARNHHGDGRVALWLKLPAGAQQMLLQAQPKHFFVPPYVGVRGWVGVRLDSGLAFGRVAALVREAYESVAPRALQAQIGAAPRWTRAPTPLKAAALDPFRAARAQQRLEALRRRLRRYPEVSEGTQFGRPVWRVAQRVFLIARIDERRLRLSFWVGVAQQRLYTEDARFAIPKYFGHLGWIALDVQQRCDWREVSALTDASYRHFASRTLLKSLDAQPPR